MELATTAFLFLHTQYSIKKANGSYFSDLLRNGRAISVQLPLASHAYPFTLKIA